MTNLRAAAATVSLADTNMKQLRATVPVFDRPVEGDFRATALVIEADQRLCLVSIDALIVPLQVVRAATERTAETGNIPAENVLIGATHTHTGPATIDFFGGTPNAEYLRRMEEGAVQAVSQALAVLEDPQLGPNETQVEMLLGIGQEATVGRNSRLLLKDGTVGWYGYEEDDAVRPTGPYDPDLHVLAFRRGNGSLAGMVFNHSVHNIGALEPGTFSPAFYGLATQQIERECETVTAFFPGAFGSTHNITYTGSGVPPAECVYRVTHAVQEALQQARPALMGPVRVIRRPFNYRLREFDEAREEAAVRYYSDRYLTDHSEANQAMFRLMRAQMRAAEQEHQTYLTVMRLGEVAIVGIPGEMFARLGLDLRRRSPFRHTIIVGLANEEIGYIQDRQAIEDGGYQTWPGWHSRVAGGTGEAMVEHALGMLQELYDETEPPLADPALRELRADDGPGLQRFYNLLSPDARRMFRPTGWNVTYDHCGGICHLAQTGERYDMVLDDGRDIAGWCFLTGMNKPVPSLGIALAEAYRGQGWGRRMMDALIAEAARQDKETVELTVVQSNEVAWRLYEKCGFVRTGQWKGPDGQDYYEMQLKL